MIVRERTEDFIMIEQHHHAQVSGELMRCWRKGLFKGQSALESVALAVYQHDCGWIPADKEPFWNDRELAPYMFTNFPTPLKMVIYQYGIDQVLKKDTYAALLCSEHYTRFLLHDESEDAQAFVKSEKVRQKQLIDSLPGFDSDLFDYHYGLLQLFDNLSLFMCLNEPGKNEHPFFKRGIPLSPSLELKEILNLRWIDDSTIAIEEFPFEKPFTVTFMQKLVKKEDISKKGLIESYRATPFEEMTIQLTP